MPKALKYILISLAAIILLIVVGAVGILLFVDPNDYKDDITQAVQKATGRELTLAGDLELSIFPWLGLSLGQAQLSNAEGFGDTPFARVNNVDIKVKLLPLLRQRLEMKTIRLDGLQVALSRQVDGHSNWDDLVGAPTEAAPQAPEKEAAAPKPSPMAKLPAIAIGGLELTDAAITWDDEQAQQHLAVRQLSLVTGPVSLTEPVDLDLSMEVSLREPAIESPVKLKGRIAFDLGAQRYSVKGLTLDVNARGAGLPLSPINAQLAADVDADLAQQQVTVDQLQLKAMGNVVSGHVALNDFATALRSQGTLNIRIADPATLLKAAAVELPAGLKVDALTGSTLGLGYTLSLGDQTATVKKLKATVAGVSLTGAADVSQLLDNPSAQGQLSIAKFSPRKLAGELGIALPEMADKKTLRQATLDLQFAGSPQGASLKGLALGLDDTRLSGSASVNDFAKPAIRYDLHITEVDVDRYLPPPSKTPPPAAPAEEAPAAPIPLPVELLRGLDVQGQLSMDKIKAANARAADIRLGVMAKAGKIQLSPTKASLYQGTLDGGLALDVQTDTPKYSIDEKLTHVVIGPLLKDLLDDDMVHGTGNVSANLNTQGLTVADMKQHLNGKAAFSLRDGAVKGVNLGQLIREAYAKIKKKPAPPKQEKKTDFAELSGSVSIKNGVVSNHDLSAKSPLLRIGGKGTVDLPRERIDYLVNASIVESAKGQAGEELDELKALTIPIKVTGSFSKPKFGLDLKPILEAKAREKLEQKKEEIKEKVEEKKVEVKEKAKEKVEDEKARLKKKLEDKLKNKLKGLF
jgi:AsmA protein